ncbi:MAG TPA: lipopolysaccharide biosynthesis protein [Arenimonas sp.]|nr:lipopolysaccharide biosynthesis protein [Arenimonas sp.]
MTFKNSILGNLRCMLFAKFVSQLITWGITLFVMRILRPEDYGLIAMATILVGLLTMINEMGLGQAIVQADSISEYKLQQCFGLVVLVNSGSYILLCLLSPLASWFFNDARLLTIVPVIGIQFLIQIFVVVPSAILDRDLKFKERSIYEVMAVTTGAISTLLMAIGGFEVWSIVFGNLIMATAYAILINWRYPFLHKPVFKFFGVGKMAEYGFLTILNRLLWYFYSQVDSIIVGRLLGTAILGAYSVGIQIASLPLVKVSGIFNQLAFAGFSSIKNNSVQVGDGVIILAQVASFISVPIFWGIAAVANEFVMLVLGPEWELAILPLQCIALILPLRVLSISLAQAINAIGRPGLNAINLSVACIVMPIAFFIGISLWGIIGVCVSWIVVYPLWFVYVLKQGLPRIGLSVLNYLAKIAPPYLIGVLMVFIVWSIRSILPFQQWVNFSVLVLIGAISYATLSWIFIKNYALRALSVLQLDKM